MLPAVTHTPQKFSFTPSPKWVNGRREIISAKKARLILIPKLLFQLYIPKGI